MEIWASQEKDDYCYSFLLRETPQPKKGDDIQHQQLGWFRPRSTSCVGLEKKAQEDFSHLSKKETLIIFGATIDRSI